VLDEAERGRVRNLRLVARLTDLQRTFSRLDDSELSGEIEAVAPVVADLSLAEWGHLEVRGPLGRGSYSEVFRAYDPQLDVEVALKVLRGPASTPEEIERLLAEPRALARVRQQNVVSVYGARTHDGRAGLWMELVEGQTLKALQAERGLFSATDAVLAGIDLCRALSAVHTAGLVHGDVKAQNVMRDARDGRLVLMDFGSGRPVGGGPRHVGGTPLYTAPEVLAGLAPDGRSDIYSLGVLLFHLLTNRYPFEAESIEALTEAHAERRRHMLRELRPAVPAPIVEVVEQALANDPDDRFQTPAAMEGALRQSIGLGRQPWSRAAVVVLGSAAVLAIGMVGGQAAMRRAPAATDAPTLVAVLPFTSPAATGLSALSAGLSNEIATALQEYHLPVLPLSAEPTPDLRSVFSRAAAIELRGSVTREGKLTQVRAWLTDQRRQVRWSHTYTAWQDDLPLLKASIAGDVAAALAVERHSAPVTAAQHTPPGAAYDEYVIGRAKWRRRSSELMEQAVVHYQRALELDPTYAEAWAGLSDANLTLGINAFGSLTPAEARRRAKVPALKALLYGENLPEVQTSLAFAAYLQDWDWPAAEEHFKKAIHLNPQYALAHQWYSDFLTAMGRHDEAKEEILEASRLDPTSILVERDIAWGPFMTGRYEEAVALLQPIVAANHEFAPARTLLARCLGELGQYRQALDLLAGTKMPGRVRGAFSAYILAASGDMAGARRVMQDVEVEREGEYLSPYYIALAHNALRDRPVALQWLRRALNEQDPMMVNMRSDWRLRNLRDDPEFQHILTTMKFPPY
jgi:tetratricopeptide (TPR) repeat protein